MTRIAEHFPAAAVRHDFYGNVGILIFDLAFLAFLLWDLIVTWRTPGVLTRLGTICIVLGLTLFRLYSTWALWAFAPAILTHQRVWTDGAVIALNVAGFALWMIDRGLFRRRQRMERG